MENDDFLQDLADSFKEEPIDTSEETKIFDLVIALGKSLLPCEVYFARATDGSTFTRVVLYPGVVGEMMVDMDKWEDEWIDMYSGECSPWTKLVGAAIDFKIIENKKD